MLKHIVDAIQYIQKDAVGMLFDLFLEVFREVIWAKAMKVPIAGRNLSKQQVSNLFIEYEIECIAGNALVVSYWLFNGTSCCIFLSKMLSELNNKSHYHRVQELDCLMTQWIVLSFLIELLACCGKFSTSFQQAP